MRHFARLIFYVIVWFLILALEAAGQSGTFNVAGPTNGSLALIQIPPPGPGVTQLRIEIANRFDQSSEVTSTFASDFFGRSYFGNSWSLDIGTATLTSYPVTRTSIPLNCGLGTVSGFTSNIYANATQFSTNMLQFGAPTLNSRTRSSFRADIPFKTGVVTIVHASTYFATIEYRYL